MPLVTSRTELSQGTSATTGAADTAWVSSSGASTVITSTALMPDYAADDIFEVRDAELTENNGLYIATGVPTTSNLPCDKIFGADPSDDAAQTNAVTFLGDNSADKTVFIDTAGLGIAIIENQGNVDSAGVTGQAIYSFIMQEFKDDDFLIANAPFPMLAIDSDAGKYIIGQDISGNNNGFNWADESVVTANNPIRTRKMLRNAGWDEVDANGVTIARSVGVVTLGVFEDALDNAYFQFGNDTTVDDTVDFTFADAVNEAVEFFTRLADGAILGGTGITLEATGQDLPRTDGGDWRVDGFKVGGQIEIRDAETSTNDGTFLLKTVGSGVDGTMTVGTEGTAAFPMDVNAQDFTRTDGGSFIADGFYVGGNIISTSSEDGGANDANNIVTVVTASTVTHAGSAMTPNADDEAVILGLFDDALGADTTINASVNNDNELTLKLRVRDADLKGKTFAQANLASAGKTILGNFVYAFPLANAADQKIDATDTTITTSTPYVAAEISNNTDGDVTAGVNTFTSAATPFTDATTDVGRLITIQAGNNIGMYEIIGFTSTSIVTVDRDFGTTEGTITYQLRPQGMSVEYFSTAQVRSDLVGGAVNFGIIITGNNGTAQEVFEFVQYKLRTLGDIDSDADLAVGRTMDGLARFVGDTGEFGTPDGLSFPRNPDGGGSGVYVDGLNATSKNDVVFYDNLNAAKTFPETIAVTLDFNAIAITTDTTTQYDLFYDRTIRTLAADLDDFALATTAGGTITSATTELPANAEIVVGSYVRVSGLTAGDAPMNGVYQIQTITTPGADWIVTRYDGVAVVTVAATAVDMDQNCVDTPDAIIVHSNVRLAEVGASPAGTALLAFASPDIITDTQGAPDLAKFTVGMKIEIEGTTANDGIFEVAVSVAGQLDLVEQTITTEAVGVDTTGIITEAVSGLASLVGDVTFSYDFDANTQGGHPISTTTFVKAKAIGSTGAQYVQSTVQSIVSGTPLTIPVAPATERNYA